MLRLVTGLVSTMRLAFAVYLAAAAVDRDKGHGHQRHPK
jgi:hypothetical protein